MLVDVESLDAPGSLKLDGSTPESACTRVLIRLVTIAVERQPRCSVTTFDRAAISARSAVELGRSRA